MTRFIIAAFALLAFSTLGCAEEEEFAACPFDQTITQNCAKGDGTASFTCVVEAHPQCPDSICLSWKNSEPFCTKPCTPGGLECPSGSKCATYNETNAKFFCVQDHILNP